MKISSIETFCTTQVCIVRVRTSDGAEGYGQTAPFHADITAQVLHRQVARHYLGADPLQVDELADRCLEGEYKFPGSYVCRALAGVDTALWDLRGKVEGKGVCELLGSRSRPLAAYASSMRRDISPEEEAARMLRLRDAHGFHACKVRVGRVCGRDIDQWPGRTESLIATVRKAMGDEFVILADGNSCYSAPKAIEVGRFLEQHNVGHFEEPCPYWELEQTAAVAAALHMPVAGGEQDFHLPTWRRIFELGAVDIAQPDVCYVGGLTRALRVAAMARAAGLPVVPHSANTSMVLLFTVHLMAALPNAGPHVEYGIERTTWTDGLYEPSFQVRDGCVRVPEGPGWGVRVGERFLQSATRAVSEA